MFNFGNPSVRRWSNKTQTNTNTDTEVVVNVQKATYGGVAAKSVLLLAIMIAVAVAMMFVTRYAIFKIADMEEISQSVAIGFAIGCGVAIVLMIVCSIVISAKPKLAVVFGPIYSVIQGAFLGMVAGFLELIVPFISVAAILGTVLVFVVCLLLHKAIGVRIKSGFLRGLLISLVCFALLQAIAIPVMLFVPNLISNTALIWIQAIISFMCIIFAADTLIYDVQAIDGIVQGGADKQYEWGVAFSLLTSLVYLYLQILQLLIRIIALFGKKK